MLRHFIIMYRFQPVWFSVSCHIYLSIFVSLPLSLSFSSYFFCLLLLLIDDVNANPNKRQRQPALLGDHPSEYGKALAPLGNKNMH